MFTRKVWRFLPIINKYSAPEGSANSWLMTDQFYCKTVTITVFNYQFLYIIKELIRMLMPSKYMTPKP